jgi:hypothetical protein
LHLDLELTTPRGGKLQRVGNVICLENHFLDVDFEAVDCVTELEKAEKTEFFGLSSEFIQKNLLSLLDEKTLLQLSQVDVFFHNLVFDAVIWMELFACRFGYLPPFLNGKSQQVKK